MWGWLCVAVALMLAKPAVPSADETSSFVVKLGSDTLSVEQFTRTATQVRGEYVVRTPRASHRTYTIDLDSQGQARRFELIVRTLGGGRGRAETRFTIDFTADSAFTMAPRGDSSFTTRMATGRGAAPSIFGVMGLIDQLGRQARAAGQPTYQTPLVSPGASQPMRGTVNRAGGDTLFFYTETNVGKLGPWILRVDETGRLLAYSGPGTPFQGEGRKVPSVDIAGARAAYTTRPLGPLSARDTTRAQLGGDSLWVDYGRPMKRGREVFGNVVPWNAVWRTGANAATQFRTGTSLTIGGATVPAGLYTLWTLPTPGGWKFIINKQTGQWGTVYDAAQDLARVDMTIETLAEAMERFTIEIEAKGADATMRLSWDRIRASVPISRKQ